MQVNVFFSSLILVYETPEVFTTLVYLTSSTPNHFELYPVYSNPFNLIKKINFGLIETDLVTLKVYDILGKEIATLINNEEMKAGSYTVDFNGNSLSNGIYIYVLKTSKYTAVNKMTLLK